MQTFNFGGSLPECSVLFVEDNEDDFELIEHHLVSDTKSGLAIEHCENLGKALGRLQGGGIDIILLDLSLPDSQGIDTVKKVHRFVPEIPIIVLSGMADINIALESLKHGAEDYLIKSAIDRGTLCRSINYALARHGAREENARLATIVEASDDAIIGKTLNGTITSWNKGAAKLFGYSAEEVTGKSVAMLIPPDSPTELSDILTALKKGETLSNIETVRLNKKGDRIDILATISPILRADGTISGAAAIDRDITESKKAQKVLFESEERYRLLVAGVKDYAIFMLDQDGLVQSWNDGAKRLKGYESAEVIGKHFSVFYSSGDQKLGLPDLHLEDAVKNGSSEEEGWRIRKDGSSFFADVVITPLFAATGELRGFAKITRDITDRKLAEREIADTKLRLSLALEAASVGVWDFDLMKNSVWRSLRHDEIFGHLEPLREWNFDTFMAHVLAQDVALAREAFQLAIQQGKLMLQCRIIRSSDGEVRWIAATGETIRNDQGKPIRMLGTVVDITDVKEQQEQQRLLAIMKEREDFMATLTHDMKNPLIGANRLLEIFVSGGVGTLTSQQLELLECLLESNQGLLTLIADLIDVYRLEKDVNNFLMADCDLIKMITSCANRVRPFAKLRSVEITTDLPESVMLKADKSRLERVVQNLLDNALKFAPDGGHINIKLVSAEGKAVIEIEDNGPGIAPEEQSLLFKRFSQGTAGKRYTGGSGLGLYVCKQIVEGHGGAIECQSQPNEKTTFRVSLPEVSGSLEELSDA
jgi:PAS domain S-box-containing protein